MNGITFIIGGRAITFSETDDGVMIHDEIDINHDGDIHMIDEWMPQDIDDALNIIESARCL